jgi:hypothetical protein
MQQCEPFRETAGLSFVIVVLAVPAMTLMSLFGGSLREKVATMRGSDLHEGGPMHHFTHQCSHTEREAAAFANSFLLAQVLQYLSTDSLAPLHAVPKGKDLQSALAELCVSVCLGISVVLAGWAEHAIATHNGNPELMSKEHSHDKGDGHEMSSGHIVVRMIKDTLAFTAGWVILHAIKLCFWSTTNDKGVLGQGDVMTSHVMIVFISSTVTLLMFFAIDYVADRTHGSIARGLRALGKAFMLLLGLAWEGAFWEGAHSMSNGMELDNKTERMIAVILLSLIFVAIVMPAWIMYIVPHTIEFKDDELHVKDYDDHEESPTGVRVSRAEESFAKTVNTVEKGFSSVMNYVRSSYTENQAIKHLEPPSQTALGSHADHATDTDDHNSAERNLEPTSPTTVQDTSDNRIPVSSHIRQKIIMSL